MIDLYGTIINENELIGVGPLMVKRPADPTISQLYNERAFYFEVYTQRYHFTISTDWLPFNEGNTESSKLAHKAILEAHKALKNCLISGSFTELSVSSDPNY